MVLKIDSENSQTESKLDFDTMTMSVPVVAVAGGRDSSWTVD